MEINEEQEEMKIAFIGTHGTGKTTKVYDAAASLKKMGHNVNILTEVARESPFPINEKQPKEAGEWMLFRQYTKELELHHSCDILVADRSILDYYIYHLRLYGGDKTLERFVLDRIPTYTHLIYVPINPDFLKQDGTRSVDPTFQMEIDEEFRRFLINNKIKHRALRKQEAK
jgi:hypothetical protein